MLRSLSNRFFYLLDQQRIYFGNIDFVQLFDLFNWIFDFLFQQLLNITIIDVRCMFDTVLIFVM